MPRLTLPISSRWFQGAILTYLFGFTVLGTLAWFIYEDQPPIPARVVDGGGRTIFTREDVLAGMNVFERYGLMEYGTIYGHGAYLGPDFTAQYLHRSAQSMIRQYGGAGGAQRAEDRVRAELHRNTYDAAAGVVRWSDARAAAHRELVGYYRSEFENRQSAAGRQAEWITDPEETRRLMQRSP